ncbi:MAG: type IV toxin-antitoxin system AbiEi family antitoxin domain-containing protein [Elusimicrobiota bacterium]|nr:type IV toxin-antitoxin system AbiEi family antitoxin domain-containing protein [Elusimicrobiota bacterium]
MTALIVQQKLAQKGLRLFTTADFRRTLGLSLPTAYKALERYAKQGAVIRLRNGLYSLPWNKPGPLTIANALYRPSYISYESALAHYHLIPETVYAVTSATTRRTKEFEAGDFGYLYHSIKKTAFTGYRPYKVGDELVLMAEPEKALCDYLFLVFLKKRALNERIAWRKVDRKKLLQHARLFKPKTFLAWVDHAIGR